LTVSMLPFLILSDIHANQDALQAVLADASGKYQAVVCLGDLVGYGADPNAVVDWARAETHLTIRGNHDVASVGQADLEDYNPAARASTHWTQSALSSESRAYLERLPRGPVPFQGCDLVHGSPLDENEYLISAEQASAIHPYLAARVTFFGHTHRQGGFLMARSQSKKIAADQVLELEREHSYLVNPGSVGQPRDGDPRAAYAFFWPEQRIVEFRRVEYDVNSAASKILAAGLPDYLALRLHEGI
jgi:predicted phosphodiesterase